MTEDFVLNQRDNIVWPWETLDRESRYGPLGYDSQCLAASGGSWLNWFAAQNGVEIDDVESALIRAMQLSWKEDDLNAFASRLGYEPSDPAAKGLYIRRGRPTSTLGMYSAARRVLQGYGLDLMRVHPADDLEQSVAYYEDGTPFLVERRGDGPGDVRHVYEELAQLGGGLVCLGSWTTGGHYNVVVRTTPESMLLGDPYGMPCTDYRQAYVRRHPLAQRAGTVHAIDYSVAAAKSLTSRIMRFVGAAANVASDF